jgi:hypothetical protein
MLMEECLHCRQVQLMGRIVSFLFLETYESSLGTHGRQALFKVHPKDVTGDIVFDDVGILHLSSNMHRSNLACHNWRATKKMKSSDCRKNNGCHLRVPFAWKL